MALSITNSSTRLYISDEAELGHGDYGSSLFLYFVVGFLVISSPLFRKINSSDYPITMDLLIMPHLVCRFNPYTSVSASALDYHPLG
jgi:hypothetical protein